MHRDDDDNKERPNKEGGKEGRKVVPNEQGAINVCSAINVRLCVSVCVATASFGVSGGTFQQQ